MIKVERLPSYLSPSALMNYESMINTFYLTRLISEPMEREPQGMAAASGSAFDCLVKLKMIEDKFSHKKKHIPELKNSVEIPGDANKEEAFRAGETALKAYTNCGAFNINEFHDIELQLNGSLEGVPIFGKLDSSVYDLRGDKIKIIPHDWKVQGYTSKSNVSPKKGYYRLWEGIRPKPAHNLYHPEIPFELIDPKWATQVCTYGWLLGYKVGEPFYARIDALLWGSTKIRVIAQYRGLISKEFQLDLIHRYKELWRKINDGSILNELASDIEDLVWIASKQERWF